jgi:hypothetical protein
MWFHAIPIHYYIGSLSPDPDWRKSEPNDCHSNNEYKVDHNVRQLPVFSHSITANYNGTDLAGTLRSLLLEFIENKAWLCQALFSING